MAQCKLGEEYAKKIGATGVACVPCTQCGKGNFKSQCTATSDAVCIKPVAPPNSPHWMLIVLLVLVVLGFVGFLIFKK